MIKAAFKPIREKIGAQLSKAYNKGKDFLKKVIKPSVTTETDKLAMDRRLKNLQERVNESTKHMDPHLVPEEMQPEVHIYVRQLATEGFHDGVIGLKTENCIPIARARAYTILTGSIAVLAKKKGELQESIAEWRAMLDDRKAKLKLHHDYEKYLQHHYKFNERGYSWIEFVIYMVSYLFLFFADLPLAAEMLRHLFAFNGNSIMPFWEHWNVWAIAIGMGLVTIFIKYCFDDLLGRKYGHAVISHKKFAELFSPEKGGTDLTSEELDEVKRNAKSESRTKKNLLYATIATIIFTGIFRAFAFRASQGAGAVHVPPVIIALAVITIVLLFAVVGGACLSLALTTLINKFRLKRCTNEAADLEKQFAASSKELIRFEGELAYTQAYMDKIEKEQTWENILFNFFMSFYKLGFDEGYANPGYFMQELTFFERVIYWREQAVSGKINADINNN